MSGEQRDHRVAVWFCAAIVLALGALDLRAEPAKGPSRRVPVIDVTDLYLPPEDPGDNFDLIAAYALPEVDLRAVIWNVRLDPRAITRLLRSDLPIAIYPCATKDGPFAYGPHNCFWKLSDLRFIQRMDPALRRYLGYAFSWPQRLDFLRALEEDPPPATLQKIYARSHNVWETGVWLNVAGRRLVRRADGQRPDRGGRRSPAIRHRPAE